MTKILKKCCDCKTDKTLEEYSNNKLGKYGKSAVCRPCFAKRSNEYRSRIKIQRSSLEHIECPTCKTTKHKSEFTPNMLRCIPCNKDIFLRTTFGIDINQYNQKLSDQKDCCAICNRHKDMFVKAFAVDHNHSTGQIRSLLCMNCNTLIGQCNDDTKILQNAINYLDSFILEN